MICPACAAALEPHAAFCGLCGHRLRPRRTSIVGTILDEHYRIEEKLGEGAFGVIYRASHLPSGDPCALKVLHRDLARRANLAARFRREGEVLASLRDRHTVTTFALGEAMDGTLYIAMELLRGESLLERFRTRGPLPWRTVLAIMRAVCSSLAEAHALGIVHRDLKPANIHLDDRDFVKVLDFGVAKLLPGSDVADDGTKLTRFGQAVGTLEYMAPEQLVGADCDGRADIYALGVVAYELITGRRPFSDTDGPEGLITAVLTRVAPPPSSLVDSGDWSRELDPLLLRCLERDADQRFANVVELATVIEDILAATDGAPAVSAPWATPRYVPGDELRTWVDGAPPQIAAHGELAQQTSQAPAQPYVLLRPLATLLGAPPAVRPRSAPASLPAFEFLVAGSTVGPPPRRPGAEPSPPQPVPPPTHPIPPVFPTRRARPRLTFGTVLLWVVLLAASGAASGAIAYVLTN